MMTKPESEAVPREAVCECGKTGAHVKNQDCGPWSAELGYSKHGTHGQRPAVPRMSCPKCKAVSEDHDGFGVMHCEKCGYCKHAALTDGKCDFCGQRPAEADKPTSRQVMNPPADEAEAGNLANTAPRQPDHDGACRGKTGTSSWPEARPVTASAQSSAPAQPEAVRRYDIYMHSDDVQFMRECADGDYVTYEALALERAAHAATREALEKAKAERLRWIVQLLKARDEFVKDDYSEAWHQLYQIASPDFTKLEPWAEFEQEELAAHSAAEYRR